MPSFTVGSDPRFPPGTVLHCYPDVGLRPSGPSVDSVTVTANGTATFDGLAYATRYIAGASVAGPFVAFRTEEEPELEPNTPSEASIVLSMFSPQMLALLVVGRVHDGANYPERIDGVAFNHWVGPSEPPEFEDGDVWTPTA